MLSVSDFIVDVAKRIAQGVGHGSIVPNNNTVGSEQPGTLFYVMRGVTELPSRDAERVADCPRWVSRIAPDNSGHSGGGRGHFTIDRSVVCLWASPGQAALVIAKDLVGRPRIEIRQGGTSFADFKKLGGKIAPSGAAAGPFEPLLNRSADRDGHRLSSQGRQFADNSFRLGVLDT